MEVKSSSSKPIFGSFIRRGGVQSSDTQQAGHADAPVRDTPVRYTLTRTTIPLSFDTNSPISKNTQTRAKIRSEHSEDGGTTMFPVSASKQGSRYLSSSVQQTSAPIEHPITAEWTLKDNWRKMTNTDMQAERSTSSDSSDSNEMVDILRGVNLFECNDEEDDVMW